MRLTRRQREILEGLASDDHDLDLVEDGNVVYFGLSRTSLVLVNFLLRHALIKGDSLGGCIHYEINEWGRRVLSDPDFDPALEILRLRGRVELAAEAEES